MPAPVRAEQGRIGALARLVPASKARTSSVTAAIRSGPALSALVMATMPFSKPSRSRMAACSRVCGMTPSSAATTRRAQSTPVAPATMVRTSRSWPGTSTKPRERPSGRA